MKCCLGISNFLEEISSLSDSIVFLFFCIVHLERLSYLSLLFFGTLHSDIIDEVNFRKNLSKGIKSINREIKAIIMKSQMEILKLENTVGETAQWVGSISDGKN